MLSEFIDAVLGDTALTALRRRRERRARERGRVLGIIRLRSGETSGVSAHWHEHAAQVHPGHLESRKFDIAVLAIQRRSEPIDFSEKALFASLDMKPTILEVKTPTAVLEWALPTRDLQWVTERLGFTLVS